MGFLFFPVYDWGSGWRPFWSLKALPKSTEMRCCDRNIIGPSLEIFGCLRKSLAIFGNSRKRSSKLRNNFGKSSKIFGKSLKKSLLICLCNEQNITCPLVNVNFYLLVFNSISHSFNIESYYTTQAVRGPITTKINQSKCSISGPIFSKYRTGHCPEWSRTCVFASLCFLQSCNKSLINQACSGPYWDNIGPRSFLYEPRCARSVLSRPWADILPVRPSRLVNKIYEHEKIKFISKCGHVISSISYQSDHKSLLVLHNMCV